MTDAGLWLSLLFNSTDGETVAGLWLSLLLNSTDGETVADLSSTDGDTVAWLLLSLYLNSTNGETVSVLWLTLLLDFGCLCISSRLMEKLCWIVDVPVVQLNC